MNRKGTVKKYLFILFLSMMSAVLYALDVLMADILASNISWDFMEEYIPLFLLTVSLIFLVLSIMDRGKK